MTFIGALLDQMFQCSSASRKFLNTLIDAGCPTMPRFQCSSASRKFLNARIDAVQNAELESFSALQRAENSSIGERRR